jgi:acyl dehydratase
VKTIELSAPPSIIGSFARGLRPGGGRAELLDQQLVLTDHRIDPANLAAYQRLCDFPVSSQLPATYVHVQAFPLAVAIMADPAFPLPLLGLVHVQNQIIQHRAVTADEALTLTVHAQDLRPHRSGRQVDLVAQAQVGDELVWSGVSTYLQRQKTTDDAPRTSRPERTPPVPSATWRLPKDIGRRYAALAGDRNPIHLSALSAKAFGFRRAIVHGMYLHARTLAAIGPRRPDRFAADATFKAPALLPSTVALELSSTASQWHAQVSNARTGRPHFTLSVTPE